MSAGRPEFGRTKGDGARGDRIWAGRIAASIPMLVSIMWGHQLHAQGLQPAVGPDLRVGDLRDQFQPLAGAVPAAWIFTPSLDISETFDSAVQLRNGRFGSDFITRVTPGFSLTGDSARLTGNIFYAPQISIYAKNGNLNGVPQNLNASVTATLVENLLYVDLRGYAAQQSLTGGQPQQLSTIPLSQQNNVQTASFSISPYIRHSFGGTGTLEIGYSIIRSLQNTNNEFIQPSSSPFTQQAVNSNLTTQQEHASFTTGEDFGRLQNTLSLVATQYSGGGALSGAYNNTINNQTSYAVSRFLTVFGSLGYENILYNTQDQFKINDITWSGGVRLTPNEDSSISISYGRSQGQNSLTVDASFSPTARTRIYANYSQGLGTTQQNLQNGALNSVVNSNGVSINPVTGAPLILTNNFFGTQNSLYRTTRLSMTGALLLERDTISVSVTHDDYKVIDGQPGSVPSNSGVVGSLAWTHTFSEALTSNTYLEYGTRNASGSGFAGGNNQTSYAVSVGLNYAFTETLSGYTQYAHTGATGNTFGIPPSRDVVIVGLHKAF
jgi:uncharacterized protein (PEP-CTERM system associated)